MTHNPLPIFVSYASYDNKSENPEERWLDRLLQFLKPLELEGKIATWADTELTVGTSWRAEIKSSIEAARVAILLVSPAFLASEFIRSHELPRLLKLADTDSSPLENTEETVEGTLVLPILIRPCLIDKVSFTLLVGLSEARTTCLADFQYLPKGKAMNGLVQYEQDQQFEIVARRIVDMLEFDDIRSDTTLLELPPKMLDIKLTEFLSEYRKWWFNALRIQKWGSKQTGFKMFDEYSTRQIDNRLRSLSKEGNIKDKDGKKSRVYRCLDL